MRTALEGQVASNFIPTHTVPVTGLDAWEQPDPDLEPITTLGSGSQVELINRRGGWAQVRREDGLEAWTNASPLTPIAPSVSDSDLVAATTPGALGDAPTQVVDGAGAAPSAQRVGDVFTGEVVVLDAKAPLDEAKNVFIRLGVRVMPLWDGNGIVGVLERERLLEEIEQSSDPGAQTVQGLASAIGFCYDDDELEPVLAGMSEASLRDIVVLRRDKAVLGILSQP
jgi:CBS domain-containing protein